MIEVSLTKRILTSANVAHTPRRHRPLPTGPGPIGLPALDLRAVLLRTHQPAQLGGIGKLDLVKPPVTVRVAVHQGRGVHHGSGDFGDLAADPRINIAGGLFRLDPPAIIAVLALPSRFGAPEQNN